MRLRINGLSKALAIFATMVLLSGCGARGESQAVDLTTYNNQSVAWGQCPDEYFLSDSDQSDVFDKPNVQCGLIAVPARYDAQSSLPDFNIAMMRQPASGSNKLGTLFINPGGPGGSGVEQLQWLNFPQEIRETYDIIGFDPRGVKNSAPASGKPIKCSNQSDYETYWTDESTPANDKEYLATVDTLDAYYKQCNQDNPSWWTMSTKNVVSDLEIMRLVLTGSEPLNFLGSSYGTTIAAEYITRYPENVGHIALDSPTSNDPAKPADQIAEAKALEESVLRFVEGYANEKNLSVDEVKKIMLQVRQDGDDDKLRGFAGMKVIDPANEIRLSTEYMFTHGILALTYYEADEAQDYFNQALSEVSGPNKWNGSFELEAMNLDGYNTDSLGGATYDPEKIERDNSYEVMDIVLSMDYDPKEELQKEPDSDLSAQIRKVSPFWTQLTSDSSNYEYKGDREGLSWAKLATDDENIPDPPTKKLVRTNTSGKKVLVVGSRYEATTPYQFAIKTAKDLQSPLVTYNGTGHAPLAAFDNNCLNDIFIRYFVASQPPAGPVTCQK